jgi:hypothetical protein
MNVRTLIEKLKKVDGDLEIVVSEMIYLENLENGKPVLVANPGENFPIEKVILATKMAEADTQMLVIGFNPMGILIEATATEFVN